MRDFKFLLIGFLTLSLFIPTNVYAGELPHSYDEITTAQTHTGDTAWTDIPNISLTSGNFTTGNKYLLIFQGAVASSDVTADMGIRSIHGSTSFTGSEMITEFEVAGDIQLYTWFNVWTAISGEGIKMQFQTNDSAQTVTVDQLSITAMEISEDLIEGADWHYDERIASDALTTAQTATNPSVTYTPNGSDDWLILMVAQIDPHNVFRNTESVFVVDSTFFIPRHSQEAEDATNDIQMHFMMKVQTDSNASHTYHTSSRIDGSGAGSTREYGAVFAINLDSFDVHADTFNAGDTTQDSGSSLATANQQNTASITPSAEGDVFIMNYFVHDLGAQGSGVWARTQVANVDQPPTQTSDDYETSTYFDATDQQYWVSVTMETLSGANAIDLDVSTSTGTRDIEDMQIVAFSMECSGCGEGGGSPTTHQILATETVNVIDSDEVTNIMGATTHQILATETINVIDSDNVINLMGTEIHHIIATETVNVIDSDNVINLMGAQIHQILATETVNVIDTETAQRTGVYVPSGKYIWFTIAPPTDTRLGGVFSLDCGAGNYVQGIFTNGTLICTALP